MNKHCVLLKDIDHISSGTVGLFEDGVYSFGEPIYAIFFLEEEVEKHPKYFKIETTEKRNETIR